VRQGDKVLRPTLRLDADQRMVFGECTCNFFQQNKLFRGPCEHLLALRLQHSRVSRT
jgi:predicted nucleic acid-binding Zn finger protein